MEIQIFVYYLKEAAWNKNTYTPSNRIKLFIVYEWNIWPRNLNSDFTLMGCLFEGVKLAKIVNLDKYV